MDVRGEIAKMLQDMAVKVVKSARQELLERHPKLAGGELIWKNIGTLARDERLVDSYQLDGRVHGVFGLMIRGEPCSLVFDDKGYHFVRQTPRQVIDYLVNYFYQVKSYSVLACLLSHVFNKSGMRVLPFIHRDYVLMPMGTTSGKLTAWVDPLFVEEMVLTGQDNFIRYAFGFVHQSEVGSQDTLILRLRTSLLALGIFRREHYDGPINEDQWLVDFLGLDSSDLLTAAIGHLIVRNIPGERGKLRKVGRRLFLEDFTSEDQKIDEYIEKWGKCPARRRKLVKACV